MDDDVCLAHRDEMSEALYGKARMVPDLLYRKWAGLPIYEDPAVPAGKMFGSMCAGKGNVMAKAKKPAKKAGGKKKGC